MSFVAVSAGIGAVSLGVGVVKGISASKQANALQNQPRPTYQIPQEYKDNLAIAKNMAQIGLPQQQYNNQLNSINQNQAGAIGALSNSANPGGGLASIIRAGNDATGRLNAADAGARMANQKYAIGVAGQLGNQKLQQQQYNQFDRYSEDFNRAQALRGASNSDWQNAVNGASSVAGGLASTYGGGLGYSKGATSGGNWGSDLTQNPNFNYGATPDFKGLGYGNLTGAPAIPYGTNWKGF